MKKFNLETEFEGANKSILRIIEENGGKILTIIEEETSLIGPEIEKENYAPHQKSLKVNIALLKISELRSQEGFLTIPYQAITYPLDRTPLREGESNFNLLGQSLTLGPYSTKREKDFLMEDGPKQEGIIHNKSGIEKPMGRIDMIILTTREAREVWEEYRGRNGRIRNSLSQETYNSYTAKFFKLPSQN